MLEALGELWDAWSEQPSQSDVYYNEAIKYQLQEIEDALRHRHGEMVDAIAINEMVDIVSLALDWMRAHNVAKDEVGSIIRNRIQSRYNGQQAIIIRSYSDRLRQKYYPQDNWKETDNE